MNKQTGVSSKWVKTRIIARSAFLSSHIPTTLRLTPHSLIKLLHQHGMVYVKPESGSRGVGVMRLDGAKGKWSVRDGMKQHTFTTFGVMFKWLRSRINGKSYLVQKGIHVLRHAGKPVDFRVMIQKGRKVGWKVTGTVARVAHPLKAVTNGSQGGSIYASKALLQRIAGQKRATRILKKFNRLAYSTAHCFGQSYPRINELGLDIAVDRKHQCWILEVNTRPDPCPFTKLADSSMLRTIVKYGRGYGRSYNLTCNKARKGRI
ncbi:YheC/YheD family protein [Cohnella sp. WQ 127256]|uniref:YheC/YheD family protein n=1 Tax=Cohnella sp. WQ 127256 TaxID=2938790 RepID=UPI002118085D|nr:YheC/YheD family protein [Cohnella sp. WQ 127256]